MNDFKSTDTASPVALTQAQIKQIKSRLCRERWKSIKDLSYQSTKKMDSLHRYSSSYHHAIKQWRWQLTRVCKGCVGEKKYHTDDILTSFQQRDIDGILEEYPELT